MTQVSGPKRRQIEVYYDVLWNQWRFDAIPELLSPNIVFRGSLGVDVVGHDGFLKYMDVVHSAFPDFHNTIREMIIDESAAAVRLTYHGTHQGTLFGIPQTGRSIEYAGVAIFHFENDLIASGWVLGDTVSLWRQLGVVPPGFGR